MQEVPKATVLLASGKGNSPGILRALASEGYEVEIAGNGHAAMEKLAGSPFQAVVVDLDLPKKNGNRENGMSVLEAAVRANASPAVIACAGRPTASSAVRVMRLGASDLLNTPLKDKVLVSTLHEALRKRTEMLGVVNLRRVVEVFSSLHNLESTYAHLRKSIAELFHAQTCSLALLDIAAGEIVAQTPGYGTEGTLVPQHHFRLADSRVSKVMLERNAPYLTNNPPQDPLFAPGAAAEGLQNLLAVPMRTAGGPIGFIYLANRPGSFNLLDAELLMLIGEQVAGALKSAHSFDAAYKASITDPLTDLYNRRFFDARLRQEGARVRRSGRPLGLMFVDLDRFKLINDQHGHQAGNMVLIQVAKILLQSCRSEDVPARYGGDEFVALLTEADPGSLNTIARRVREGILQTNWGPVGGMTVSIGIAVMPQDAATLEDLLRVADEAMYLAKQRGRNTYVLAQDLPKKDGQASGASAS